MTRDSKIERFDAMETNIGRFNCSTRWILKLKFKTQAYIYCYIYWYISIYIYILIYIYIYWHIYIYILIIYIYILYYCYYYMYTYIYIYGDPFPYMHCVVGWCCLITSGQSSLNWELRNQLSTPPLCATATRPSKLWLHWPTARWISGTQLPSQARCAVAM